jgi:sterol desaturase/sphingolipid hydroxylase (fatty acid hydroxylase superfamily)
MVGLVILAVFAVLLVLEERHRSAVRSPLGLRRLGVNWGLGLANLGLAALVPIGALATAAIGKQGPLADASPLIAFVPLLLGRSFANYWLHRLFHWVPVLWRIHRVHHSDLAIDTSTGLRNHAFEALAAMGLAAGVVLLLAPPLVAVAAVDAVLFIAALWQHAAISLPPRVAHFAEGVVVTPRLHLIHHSRLRSEHDRNFGDLLSIWDRAFGTIADPIPGPAAIGLDQSAKLANSLPRQLLSPFRA